MISAVAEQLYDALTVWRQQCYITITSISLPFFDQLSPSVQVGNYSLSTTTFNELIAAI